MFLSLVCAPIDCRVLRLPVAWPLCRMLLLRREECAAAAALFATHDGLSQPALLARIMPSTETPPDGSLVWWDEDIRAFWGFVSSCEWVVASLPWRRRGPHRRGVVGLTARRRRRSVHRLAKTAPRRRFGALVYTVGPWAWVVGGLGIAIVYTNGRIGPLRAVLGHLCTLLRRGLGLWVALGSQ